MVAQSCQQPALHSWITEEGALLHGVAVSESESAGRRLVATRTIEPGTTLVRIPPTALLTGASARARAGVCDVMRDVESAGLVKRLPDVMADSAAIVLFLLAEFSAGDESPWLPWFRSLPKHFETPLTLDLDVVEHRLKGTVLFPLACALREELREMYDEWLIPFAIGKCPEIFRESVCTFERFLYAHSIVDSRAFKFDDVMLVPYADMANHRPTSTPGVTARTRGWAFEETPDKLGFEMYASGVDALQPGDEICISYGILPNWQLLLHYGFALENNPADSVLVSLEIPEDDDAQLNLKKLIFLNIDNTSNLQEDHNLTIAKPLPESLLSSARLLLLDESEAANITVQNADFSKPTSMRNEQCMIARLRDLFSSLQSAYDMPESMSEEEKVAGSFVNFCRTYIGGQAKIISAAQEALDVIALQAKELL